MTLRPKMLLCILPPLIFLVIALSAYSYINLQKISRSEASFQASSTLSAESSSFTEIFDKAYIHAGSLSRQLEDLKRSGFITRSRTIDLLFTELEANKEYYGIWTLWEPGAFDSNDSEIAEQYAEYVKAGQKPDGMAQFTTEKGAVGIYWQYDNSGNVKSASVPESLRQRPVYKLPFETEKPAFPVSANPTDGKLMLCVARPIIVDGDVVGVIGITIGLDSIQERAADLKPYGTGYATLYSKDGKVIYSPDQSSIGQTISTTTPKNVRAAIMEGNEFSDISISPFTGEKVLTVYKSIYMAGKSSSWCFALASPVDKIMAESISITRTMLIIGILGVIVVSVLVIIVITNVVRALSEGVAYAQSVADGNLEKNYSSNRKDEIGGLGVALGKMVNNLRERIGEAEQKGQEAAEQSCAAQKASEEATLAMQRAEAGGEAIIKAADEVQKVVSELHTATNHLSEQVNHGERISTEQIRRVSVCRSSMESMNMAVSQTSHIAGNAAEASERTKVHADSGAGVVRKSVSGIEAVQNGIIKLKNSIEELGSRAQSIGSIMTVISDIADQTNLLALNAAIEAARAGEAGRGFAVVADEVRKLAEKTMTATKEVGDAISGIQNGTQNSIKAVESAANDLDSATALAKESGEALTTIVAEAMHTAEQVRSIAQGAETQASSSHEMAASLEHIQQGAEETSEAMNASTKSVEALLQQAQHLQGLVSAMRKG